MEGSYCGYLKAHAGRGKTVYTEAFSHFCKIGGTGSCEGVRVDVSAQTAGLRPGPACGLALLATAGSGLLAAAPWESCPGTEGSACLVVCCVVPLQVTSLPSVVLTWQATTSTATQKTTRWVFAASSLPGSPDTARSKAPSQLPAASWSYS
jgi:hypothetical protein